MRRVAQAVLLAIMLAACAGCAIMGSTPDTFQVNDAGGVIDPVEARFPALADPAIKSCSGSAGSWTVTGTVRNPTSSPFLYTLVINLIDAAGATVAEVDASPAAAVKPGTVAPRRTAERRPRPRPAGWDP